MGDTATSSLAFEYISPGNRGLGGDAQSASPIGDSKLNISSCLGRTCLKWGADGELSAVDKQLVLQRLALQDNFG
jgi:hypothetical protein